MNNVMSFLLKFFLKIVIFVGSYDEDFQDAEKVLQYCANSYKLKQIRMEGSLYDFYLYLKSNNNQQLLGRLSELYAYSEEGFDN